MSARSPIAAPPGSPLTDPVIDLPPRPTNQLAETGRTWMIAFLDLVFPPFCPVCRRRLGEGRRDPLCRACWEGLERIAAPYCRVCGLPVLRRAPAGADQRVATLPLCGRCRQRRPAFSYARAAASYGDLARQALHAFKFGGRRALAAPLGDLLAEIDVTSLPHTRPDIIVPVPLHPARERDRGFNQSLLLARRLGRAWRCPVRAGVLARPLATAPQVELSAEERRANVRGAFALRRPELVAGRHVVIVDDVFTTGSTVTSCAQVLRRGGAAVIGVLTVARAI